MKLTDVEKYSTKDEYVAARDSGYVLEKIRYLSDGLLVIAYYYHSRSVEATKRPVIVYNRGSYIRGDIAPELLPMFHRLATAGFAVVAPMYRGSDGGEGRDEMGGADVNDLMNILPVLSQLEWLARDRAMVTFRDLNDIATRRSAFTSLIREWIKHV